MKKIFLTAIASILLALDINAGEANTLYISETTCTAGKQQTLTVCMNNTATINSMEFEVQLPEGMSVVCDTEGEEVFPYVDLVTARTNARKHDITSSFKKSSGNLYVTIANKSATAQFSGNDGAICTIMVNVDASASLGSKDVIIKNIVLTDASDNSSIKPSDVSHEINVCGSSNINTIIVDRQSDKYNLRGQKTSTPRGIVIIRENDGETKKIINK